MYGECLRSLVFDDVTNFACDNAIIVPSRTNFCGDRGVGNCTGDSMNDTTNFAGIT